MNYDCEGEHHPLARPAASGKAAPPVGSDSAGCGSEHGLREGACSDRQDHRDTRPDHATRFIETTHGILSYAELAPLLADRVTIVEAAILAGGYTDHLLDEWLLLDIHRRICGNLVPEWAGKWRDIEVTVGQLKPALPFQLPMLMRDYGLDLQARWQAADSGEMEPLLEFLAFAEGRFLTVHPFRDFNGRTIRLFLTELLRRLDLPRVVLAPEEESARHAYFSALEAADHCDWQPLMSLWNERLSLLDGNSTLTHAED
jgi:CRISPR-associated endonuclease/helicase Cas3